MTIQKISLTCLFSLIVFNSNADVLLIDLINKEPINSAAGIPRPTQGQSMEQVKLLFGEPNKIYPAIGEPPISRWKYASFSVYFEHHHVIHSVVNKPNKPTH
tara:strand:+ start:1749 stop:2054 length:306 start_codon:yes stop_codon:yes gene_type:complete